MHAIFLRAQLCATDDKENWAKRKFWYLDGFHRLATVAVINATEGGITISVIPRVRTVHAERAGHTLSLLGLATYLNHTTVSVDSSLLDQITNLHMHKPEYMATCIDPALEAHSTLTEAIKADKKKHADKKKKVQRAWPGYGATKKKSAGAKPKYTDSHFAQWLTERPGMFSDAGPKRVASKLKIANKLNQDNLSWMHECYNDDKDSEERTNKAFTQINLGHRSFPSAYDEGEHEGGKLQLFALHTLYTRGNIRFPSLTHQQGDELYDAVRRGYVQGRRLEALGQKLLDSVAPDAKALQELKSFIPLPDHSEDEWMEIVAWTMSPEGHKEIMVPSLEPTLNPL